MQKGETKYEKEEEAGVGEAVAKAIAEAEERHFVGK